MKKTIELMAEALANIEILLDDNTLEADGQLDKIWAILQAQPLHSFVVIHAPQWQEQI